VRRLGRPAVAVVGDLLLDRYLFGTVGRVSPEAPVHVLRVDREEERPGGAGSVAALLAGLGLHALAIGWAVTQLAPPLASWVRLRVRHRAALPGSLPPLTWPAARRHLSSAVWVSLGQFSAALVNGADVLIVGAVMGPVAVVPYVVTLKLIAVAGNLPVTVAHAAGPGLSQMRAGEPRTDLRRATDALAQAVLAASGLVACVVLAVNQWFVSWWVGADRFAGWDVTALGVALMLVRHYGTTVVFAVYSFGHERRLALIGFVEGAVTVALSIALVQAIGLPGALIGALAAGTLVVFPLCLPTLAAETATTVGGLIRALLPFVVRLAVALALAAAVGRLAQPGGLAGIGLLAIVAAAGYAALLLPVVLRPPLREYTLQLAGAVRARLGVAAG